MKKEVSPIVMIGAGVATIVLVIVLAFFFLAPHPPEATIPSAEMQNEGAIKRQNVQKKYGDAPPGGSPGAKSGPAADRTGD